MRLFVERLVNEQYQVRRVQIALLTWYTITFARRYKIISPGYIELLFLA